ncbi:MAG: Rrf2 family transcriptional regulator [Phycisphaerales bacterium]
MVTHDRWPPSDPLCSPVFAVASEYALRVMRVLASVAASSPLTRHVIAQASLIPLSDLDRVLGRLARHGFIRRRRTAGGMYTLARPATDIQVIDVIRALQPLERIRSCPLGKPEHCDGLCPLHRRLDESIGAVSRGDFYWCTYPVSPLTQGRGLGFLDSYYLLRKLSNGSLRHAP